MSLVTDLQNSTVARAWGRITAGCATKSDYSDTGINSTKDPLSKRFCRALARSIASGTLTAQYDPESQHILFVNDKGEWKARFKPGSMRSCYETFVYDFFREAGHEYGACPVATALLDLSSLPPVEAQELNPDAFSVDLSGSEDSLDEAEKSGSEERDDILPDWREFGVMSEDLFNHLTASHLPKKVENILPKTLLQPTGLVYGVIAPRMLSKEVDLVSRSKTMLLAAVLGYRDFKDDALVGSRIIDSEEIMPESCDAADEDALLRQRSTNSISSSGYGTDHRHVLEMAAFSSKPREDSEDDDISFIDSEDESRGIQYSNSQLRRNSVSSSSAESEDEESVDYRQVKIAVDQKRLQSTDQTLFKTEIHFPILGEDFNTAHQEFTSDQLQELKEFVEQLDEEALIRLVVNQKITHRDNRLETLDLDIEEEEKAFAFEDGSSVLVRESGRESEFFPAKILSEKRLFTCGQIDGFKERLSNLKEHFNELDLDAKTNLVQLISNVVPSFGHAIQTLDQCRSRVLAKEKSGLTRAMERELHLDGDENSFSKAKFGALGRRVIRVETGCLSPTSQLGNTSSLRV